MLILILVLILVPVPSVPVSSLNHAGSLGSRSVETEFELEVHESDVILAKIFAGITKILASTIPPVRISRRNFAGITKIAKDALAQSQV